MLKFNKKTEFYIVKTIDFFENDGIFELWDGPTLLAEREIKKPFVRRNNERCTRIY